MTDKIHNLISKHALTRTSEIALLNNFTVVLKKLTLCLLLISGLFISGCSGTDNEASKTFDDAKKLYSEGKELEKTSYRSALQKYVEASVKLDEITSGYPKSKIAADIANGTLKLDSMTPADFSEKFIPVIKYRADAEESPSACALLYISNFMTPESKIPATIKTAISYHLNGDDKTAEQLISQARSMADKQHTEGRFPAYLTDLKPPKAKVAEALAKTGKLDEAVKAAGKIANPFYKSVVLSGIAVEYSNIKNNKEAVKILKEACKTIEFEKDLTYRTFALLEAARGFIKTGAPKEGFRQLKEAEKLNGIQNYVSDRILVLKDIAVIYYKSGKKDEAVKYLEQAGSLLTKEKDSPWKSFLEYIIAINYAEIGLPDKGTEAALKMKDETEANRALMMIESKLSDDKADQKTKVVKAALDKANKSANPAIKAFCLANIALTYSKEGAADSAVILLEQAEKLNQEAIKREIKDKKEQAKEHDRQIAAEAKISQAYAAAGKYGRIEKAVKENSEGKAISEVWFNEDWLTDTALMLADNSDFTGALKLAEKIKTPLNTVEVLTAVALKMAEKKTPVNEEMKKSLHILAGAMPMN
ncbi:MAG: hypothetical protein LWY06_05395 [Firmicutes bacterium]|nr:hypothetical protein [Bacillota bacterium]